VLFSLETSLRAFAAIFKYFFYNSKCDIKSKNNNFILHLSKKIIIMVDI
jgi:hypothetical protein